jgi:hypothetical protein
MSRATPRERGQLVAVAAIGLILVVGMILAMRKERVIPPGTPIRFDDFAFAVVDVRRPDTIDGLRPANGSFLVVRFGVWNQAKRVDYHFNQEKLMVEDATGRRFPLATEATKRRQRSPDGIAGCDQPIPAGKSCTTDLVFDLPTGAPDPSLRFTTDPLVAVLSWFFDGRVRFALEEGSR